MSQSATEMSLRYLESMMQKQCTNTSHCVRSQHFVLGWMFPPSAY